MTNKETPSGLSESEDEFYKKYGFTMHMSRPHPEFEDTMYFHGLEAQYVTGLESEIIKLKEYCRALQDRNDHLIDMQMAKARLEARAKERERRDA